MQFEHYFTMVNELYSTSAQKGLKLNTLDKYRYAIHTTTHAVYISMPSVDAHNERGFCALAALNAAAMPNLEN